MMEGWRVKMECRWEEVQAEGGFQEVGNSTGRLRERGGQGEGAGKSGARAHLFTLMTLQTPNSIHTLKSEGG